MELTGTNRLKAYFSGSCLLFAFTVWFLDNNPIGNKKSHTCVVSFALTAKAKKGQIHTGLPLFYVLRGLSTKLCLQERMLSTDTLG